MVQIATAWAVHRATGEAQEIDASAVDKASVADYDWFCPDECCRVPLTHYNEHLQTFRDPESERSFRINVAAHFQRKMKGPAHADACTAVDDYTKYQLFGREHGVSHQNGVFVFNLNIPTDHKPAPIREKKSVLTRKFQQRAMDKVAVEAAESVSSVSSIPKSKGLKDVKNIARLLDVSGFNEKYRKSIMLRDGARTLTLADIYKDDPIAFYREEHKRAKRNEPPMPVLVHFKPIAIGKYHSNGHRTIQGAAVPIKATNGKAKYSVSILLHCGDDEIYEAVKKDIRAGGRTFLLYASKAEVSLLELAYKKTDISLGRAKDNALFVHVRIDRPEQIVQWSPPDPQLSLKLDTPYKKCEALPQRAFTK